MEKFYRKPRKDGQIMNSNDPATKDDLQSLKDFIREENRKRRENMKLDNRIDKKIDSVKKDVANLGNKVDNLENRFDNLENKVDNLENKVDNLTDAVIEGFDNTERILSDWEGKPVNLISKQKKEKLKETA